MKKSAAAGSSQSEELLRLIIENVREYAIFALDAEGVIVSWNPGVERILGYDENEFIGSRVSVIFTPADIENGEVEREMQRAASEGRAENLRWRVRRDGSRFWANDLLVPLEDANGKLRGYAKILRDETERKKHEDEREQLLAGERESRLRAERLRVEIERVNQQKDEFLALLAHELRSPLNAILGWIRILRKGVTNRQQVARALAIIERNAETQNRLIEDVFDVSRINSGNLHLNEQPISLAETVSRAVEAIRPAAEAKHIRLETAFLCKSALIMGDPDRMRQITVNLLSNAVKFTGEGGRVAVYLDCSDSTARLVIEDNGQGIGAELLPRVFERYVQADKDSTRGKAGLGLGLPLVHKLVKQHGGEVTAESAGEGRGATFTVSLPLIELKE